MARSPNLNALRMFDAAARHLNFRLASEELALTQGAVAQQVRRLEADLGCALFHRRARGLELTVAGRRYHAPVRRALALVDDATRQLLPDSRRVRLSVPPSFASKWLVPRMSDFAAKCPDIELQVLADEALSDFRTDGVDLAVRQGPPPEGAGVASVPLAPLDLCAVASPDYPAAAAADMRDVTAVLDQTLLQDSHRHWDRLLATSPSRGPRPRIVQFNQTALAIDAAVDGQGIALAPRILLGRALEHAALVVLWTEAGHGGDGCYHLIWPRLARPHAGVAAVVDWLLASAGADALPHQAGPLRD